MVTGSPKLNFIRKKRVAHNPTPYVLDYTQMETEENPPEPRIHAEHHQDPPALKEIKNDDTPLEQ